MPPERTTLLHSICAMHDLMRAEIVRNCQPSGFDTSSAQGESGSGDTIYPIDRVSETQLLDFIAREIAAHTPIVVVGEGIENGKITLPVGCREGDAKWRLIVDPIDGTRGLLYQKRSGWILTGLARNQGEESRLGHIELAVQTEIPLLKQHLCDQMWAVRGKGVRGIRWNRITHQSEALSAQPSRATTLQGGYATVCRFFPGGRDVLARIDDSLAARLLGPQETDHTVLFEDQYACTGGQLYGLMMGQDRFVADLRPLLREILAQRGDTLGHCCHPYDICTALIAEEAGVVIRAPGGGQLNTALDTTTNVAWVGFANRTLQEQVEPVLNELLLEFGLMPDQAIVDDDLNVQPE